MAKKAATSAAVSKAAPTSGSTAKPATKGEVYTKLATKTGLSKKQVSTVFESLTELIGNELGRRGPACSSFPAFSS